MESVQSSLKQLISRHATGFSVDNPTSINDAVDQLLRQLGDQVRILGLGEAMHGGEEFLVLRNTIFQHLVEHHRYTAIAVESSFPRGRILNEYVQGKPIDTDEALVKGTSHGFGKYQANRELVDWMRQYNQQVSDDRKLQFYGFDSPSEMTGCDSPRDLIAVTLDFLTQIDGVSINTIRDRIESLIGDEARWINPQAAFDPTKSVGNSDDAIKIRSEIDMLLNELRSRKDELIEKTGVEGFQNALHHAEIARKVMEYHELMATPAEDRIVKLLGLRDQIMADNLIHISSRENGKVLAFAHNHHLKTGMAEWQWGAMSLSWSPAGKHVRDRLGDAYAVIGAGLGKSDAHGVTAPEPGTIESELLASGRPDVFIANRSLASVPDIQTIPVRSAGKNQSYFPLDQRCTSDFDALVILNEVSAIRES